MYHSRKKVGGSLGERQRACKALPDSGKSKLSHWGQGQRAREEGVGVRMGDGEDRKSVV